MEHGRPSDQSTVAWYREFAPHPALRRHVRALFSFTPRGEPSFSREITFEMRCGARDSLPAPTLADGRSSIVFDLGTIFRPNGTWSDSAGARAGRILGAMRRASAPSDDGLPAAVGAYLHAGCASSFAPIPSSELTDRTLPIEDAWGRSAIGLSEQLATASESERLDLLESALLRRASHSRERESAIDIRALTCHVARHGGRVTISSLAFSAGVSRQQLTRVFRERVGVSPKTYCRLARFRSALRYLRAGHSSDWARVACEAGYADQSHMIAEFRQFSTLTPHMLATERWLHPFIERAKSIAERAAQAGCR